MAAPILLFSNYAQTTVNAAINSSAVSVVVAAGTSVLFPTVATSGQYFKLAHTNIITGLPDEIVHVTAVNTGTDTLTILRAQEGTTSVSWNVNDILAEVCTAGTMQALAQSVQVQSGQFNYAHDTGIADAYIVTLSPVPTLVDGMEIKFSTVNTNATTTPTLTVNGVTHTITLPGGTAVAAGAIIANSVLSVEYNTTGTRFELQPSNSNIFASNAQAQAQSSTTTTISPATLAAALQGTNQSLVNNGMQKLPGGLILKFGTASTNGAGDTSVTFTTAFPTNVLCLTLGTDRAGGGGVFASYGTLSATGFTVGSWTATGTRAGVTVGWYALGN